MTVEEFEEFYAHAAARLTGQLYVMLGDAQEAQDVAQEAFVRLEPAASARPERAAGGVDPHGRVAPGGEPVARAAVCGCRVAAQRSPPPFDGAGPETVALVAALRELPLRQRRALTLYYLCDMSVEQIAAETDVSPSTVKTHLVRGRAALARILHDPRIEEAPGV